jgi:hypothetical protein
MEKRLIKCTNTECNNKFFTGKVTMSNDEIKLKDKQFNKELSEFVKYGDALDLELSLLQEKIKKNNDQIKTITKDIDELNIKVQCSNCGTRLDALECEVKV